MPIPFLDYRNETSPFPARLPTGKAWLASDIREHDWKIRLDDGALEEIDRLARFIEANPLQDLQRSRKDHCLPRCQAIMENMKSALDEGTGFCVADRLPLDRYPIETMVEVYWVLGQFIGRPVAQKWNGEMIYSVHDTGVPHHHRIRGSHTSVELVFHNDNAFGAMVPDYVGLMCRNPAKSGGTSRFCSLYTVHNRLYDESPQALQRLYQPMYYNRQDEHAPGAPRVVLAPCFSWRHGRLKARINASLVRAGYEIADVRMDRELEAALKVLDDVCADSEIWFEAPLERGQVQYLNNHETGHYRSEFTDYREPEKKRHLYRLWHRDAGSACYDGGSPVLP